MNENKMYKEMTVYIEACESGSMFEGILEDDLNIYAVSAANASESSWGTYCSPDDMVDGKHVGSCLGDLFSVNWMEDTDAAQMNVETLQDQYSSVKTSTDKSHVLQWGQLTFTGETLDNFQSNESSEATIKSIFGDFTKTIWNDVFMIDEQAAARKNEFAVDSRDIQLHMLYNRVMMNPTSENHQALADEIAHRMKIDNIFESLFPAHMAAVKGGDKILPTDFDCYRRLMSAFEDKCEKLDDYSLKYAKAFVAECEALRSFPSALDGTLHRLDKVCKGPTA